ncbi:MAG TPA: hypothetical protein DHD79_09270 [Firmicutes bacterium]|nr:hypothetical protein [Bacillota bacterium]HAW70787.1 hypothetical protein [Bacillota bacterium]HAZ20734.1 hypothetical protein [Bacillota bacterium]HBE06474.1 hypothetical protein [Bacillota bacterium]HBG44773.1 hypothetical protein [Bacillota bacterium]
MSQLNQMELQNLRHLIGTEIVKARKFQDYSQQASDQALKNYFSQQATQAQRDADTIMSFLQETH